MLVNQKTFDLESIITDDWAGSHRVVIDLEALATAQDWKIGISLPDDYDIDQIYNAQLNTEEGKTYISGEDWNNNLDKGSKTEVVLIVTEGNSSNSEPILPQFFFANPVENPAAETDSSDNDTADNFDSSNQSDSQLNFNSQIEEDWEGGYKLKLDIKADRDAKNWQADFEFPYTIREVYGVDLIDRGNGTYIIKGQGSGKNLKQGQSIETIFIIDDGLQPALELDINSSSDRATTPPQMEVEEPEASAPPEAEQPTESIPETNSQINASASVTEDWEGGYKLEVDLTAESNIENWNLDFTFPYTIREIYGVDLIDRGDGKYTIKGQNGQTNLQQGQSIKSIFIVEDNGREAIALESLASGSEVATPDNNNTDSENNSTPEEPASQEDTTAEPENASKAIDVDNDFGGNLESAIASANNGDVIQLGSNVYYTDGITLDKDITIDGGEGSVVNGGGTSQAVFNLTSSATGATIQDVEITNANIGINGNGAFNLTLQNLDINNIGIDRTIRDGQNNSGILLGYANGLQLLNSRISNIGRKGVGIGDTDGAVISNLTVRDVNLAAQHSQSHDAAGIKFFNTNDITVRDNYFSDINAYHLWNDTTNATKIVGNAIENAGSRFKAPDFNNNVDISGIYNEKSSNSVVRNNKATAVGNFLAFKATEFTTQTMTLENNNFSSSEINTTDFWVNESAEKRIATTENPAEADFSLFAEEYIAQANIG